MINKTFTRLAPALLSAAILAACSVAPVYERPAAAVPAAFKEAAVDPARWKTAQPAEHLQRGDWWTAFGDAALNALQQEAQEENQDLKIGAARLAQSRTIEREARAALSPQVGIGFGPTRQRASPAAQGLPADGATSATTLWRAQAGFSYEADLFGRIGSTVAAAGADTERNAALLRSLQLAIQADVAQAYFLLREIDAELALYASTVELRSQTLQLLERRYVQGDITEVDVARGRTELAAARAESLGLARRRAGTEHALAVLLGRAPADFGVAPQPLGRTTVRVPAGLPSALLERRPDIAAAERGMAAANARIGAAQAAFFPRLSLTGALGYESNELGDLFKWSSRSFLLGPLLGTVLSLPVFDGGARQAGVDRARASYEEEVARYRQTVLQAFREVEDNLANLRILDDQTRQQDVAVTASERAARLLRLQYREGAVSFLNVIDADRSVLLQRRIAVQLDGERARSTVDLIRAMGGGWDAPAQ